MALVSISDIGVHSYTALYYSPGSSANDGYVYHRSANKY